MKEIGGYFSLECASLPQIHHDAYRLNSACSALRLILQTYGIKELFVPEYTCPTVWDAIAKEGCKCLFYKIGKDFMPQQTFPPQAFVLYNNYFGICSKQVSTLCQQYSNLIVDNAQAYYAVPDGIACFYSPRKFFGLPDGGLLYCKKEIALPEQESNSFDRCKHLLKRLDLGAPAGYNDFREASRSLTEEGVARMSNLTAAMWSNCDYQTARQRRLDNFAFLHQHLKKDNLLFVSLTDLDVPLVYPYLTSQSNLRERLIQQKVYVPKYWPNIKDNCFTNLIPLPIDQRYNLNDMARIIEICTYE